MKKTTTAATVEEFAARHRLKTSRDEDGSTIVPGRDGQMYEHGDGLLAAMFIPTAWRSATGAEIMWNKYRKEMEAAGMEVWQDGDGEGTCLFDPSDKTQSKLAIHVAGARPKRVVSPEQLARMKETLAAYRQAPRNAA